VFKRILIANRGEIALRVIRACREMGIDTVAVYSEADRNAIYLRYASESICIGPAPSAKSYLDISRVISAAEITDVDAIHPGYGFLSENSHFAEICESCRITFIGPRPQSARQVGNKARARALASELGIPIVPGSALVRDEQEALRAAHEIGFPVMIKAAAGGGGRGMRLAHNDVALVKSLLAAQAEAEAAFKDSSVYLEKYVEKARHIEFQIVADQHGNVVHLGERDCSLQRRHQKLVEECPSPVMTPELRARMGEAACKFARGGGYTSVGTVEFLVDRQGNFFFIEMNGRIQVEHPITEVVTGIDLVKEQIRAAAGEKLTFRQEDVRWQGHAIECRVNAEDPDAGFRPCPGKITLFFPPGGPGVRVDTHAYTGYEIPPNYDSLVAKIIAFGANREAAICTMRRALEECVVDGVKTTIPLYLKILEHSKYLASEVDTTWVESVFGK